jgi:hypothetical protein
MIDRYKQFVKDEYHFETMAQEYGYLYLAMSNMAENTEIEDVSFHGDSVTVTWQWWGGYGAIDRGSYFIPVEIFCNRDSWKDHIQAEIDAKKLKEKQDKETEAAKRKMKDIEAAKKLLQHEGMTVI